MTGTIHRFWAGPPMPDDYRRFGERWTELNPGWQVITWDDFGVFNHGENVCGRLITDLQRRDNYRGTEEYYVQLADVIGYELLYRFGGVYVNCDMEPVRPLADAGLEWEPRCWASYENDTDGRIVNAAIGAPKPGHDFWHLVLQEAEERYFSMPGEEMVMTTGPGMLTDVVDSWRRSGGAFRVLPRETFNPVHWSEIEAGGDATGREYPLTSVAVHHWGHRRTGRSNTIPA